MSETLLRNYAEDVLKAPSSLGLTAAKTVQEFWERHILDAIKLLKCLPVQLSKHTLKVIDLGSGNGIPGIPMAILNPLWHVTLVDSDNNKCGFIDMICNKYSIKNTVIISERSEKLAHKATYRESFDLAFARAFSKLPVVIELGLPFLKVSGLLIVPHGTSYKEEVTASVNALKETGGFLENALHYSPTPSLSFVALMIKKRHPTPDRYPRRIGIPTKRPL